jgi:WD40 repeat protein
VAEFKPCIGQAAEDLAAQGRPDKARYCVNPACPRPGWAWSLSLEFCGFCGGPLAEPAARWQPQFPYSAAEALDYSRLLLGEVRLHLERRLNEPLRGGAGWEIVAGVPVHWQAGTRASYHQVLAQAFPEAGISLMSEPEGALRYYGCQGLVRAGEGWTLVVDFGAGTTDLVFGRVFQRGGDALLGEVRAYGERYGGADFDLLLARHAAAELGVELDPTLLARWKLEAQRWKEAFSDAAQSDTTAETGFSFPVPTGGQGFDFRQVTLDRPTFNRVAGQLMERFRSVLERGLRHFNASPESVTQVVLTGGGAQWFFVAEAVRELFPGAHWVGGVEPVRAIARGLALAPALPQLLERGETPAGAAKREVAAARPAPVVSGEREPAGGVDAKPTVPASPAPAKEKERAGSSGSPVPAPAAPAGRRGMRRATLLRTLRVTDGKLTSVALSPDGSTVATGVEAGGMLRGKGRVVLWDTETGAQRLTLPGLPPRDLAFSPAGDRLASLCAAGMTGQKSRVSLLEPTTGSALWSHERDLQPRSLTFSPAGDRLVSTHMQGSGAGRTLIWNASGVVPEREDRVPVADPRSVAFSPDGGLIAVACGNGSGVGALDVRVYESWHRPFPGWLQLPETTLNLKWAFRTPDAGLAFSPDGETLAVGSRTRTSGGTSGQVCLYRWRPDRSSGKLKQAERYADLVAAGRVRTLLGHSEHVVQVAYLPDGCTLVSGSDDGTVILWDLESSEARQVLSGHQGPIMALAVSRTGERMVTASPDGTLQVWALE